MFGTPSRCKVLVFHALLWKPCLENWTPKEERKEGRNARLRRRAYRNYGPNDTWHCDGYDKLKPFGFPIHACIDGWMHTGTANVVLFFSYYHVIHLTAHTTTLMKDIKCILTTG